MPGNVGVILPRRFPQNPRVFEMRCPFVDARLHLLQSVHKNLVQNGIFKKEMNQSRFCFELLDLTA